jgi:hypothetical protein
MSSVQAAAVTLENRYVQGDNDTPRSSFESYATDVSVDNRTHRCRRHLLHLLGPILGSR